MSQKSSLSDVFDGLRSIKKAGESGDAPMTKPAVAYLLGAIDATENPRDKSLLLGLLAIEYGYLGMDDDELRVSKESVETFPDAPMPHISLSSTYLLREQYPEARQSAEMAVSVAESDGHFRRHALQTLARALRKLQAFGELEVVLEKLIGMTNTGADAAVETDFLYELPPGSIREDLKQQYLALQGSRARKPAQP
jgi:hypothetical protein